MTWLRKISYADLITIGNGVSGFVAITYIIDGKFYLAYAFIILAIFLDGLDGIVARKYGSNHSLGRYLDLSADTISFCFAPAILLYSTFYDVSKGSAWVSLDNATAVAVSAFVVVAGILHLARCASRTTPDSHFVGLPTAASASLIVAFALLMGENGLLWGKLQYPLLLIATLASVLVVSGIGYAKIKGNLRFLAILALGSMLVGTLLRAWGFEPMLTVILALIGLVLCMVYVVVAPFKAPKRTHTDETAREKELAEKS
jgi:CDP-diacylglycerol--serine O-phosphatidyltransferase